LRRKKPSLADFGLLVTICMAAFSQREQCMVTVSDTMLSYDNAAPATDEATEKIFLLKGNWRMLFAGSVIPINGVLTRIYATQQPTSDFDDGPKELDHLKKVCREAYQAERRQRVTDRFLSVYNMTLDDFRREGLENFGVQEFAKINEKIRDFDLDLTILVCGFDKQGFPHIFEVGDPGQIAEHDLLGYAAIGSGADMARGILTPRSVKRLPWREMMYRLCQAKFASETATGVGRVTSVLFFSRNGIHLILPNSHVEKLRSVWDKERSMPIVSDVLDIIDDGLGISRNSASN
jgi:hypothetical protein